VTTFIRAVHAESTKLFTTRIWWVLLVIMFAYVAMLGGGLAALFGATAKGLLGASSGVEGMPTDGISPMIYSLGTSVGYVFPFLLGALATTGEFRHQTLTPTFLATPRRGVVLGAKWVMMLLAGAGFGVVALIGTVGVGGAVLAVFDVDTAFDSGDTWALVARSVLAMALWAAIGVGLGAAVPNQVATIVIVIAFTQFVEPILRSVGALADWVGTVTQWLPGAASDALVGAGFYQSIGDGTGSLEWWQGGLVLLGIAIVIALIGWLLTWRRDVT